jgi:uncharacterized lipoprotein YddW (UPF0748 family)
MKKAGFDAVYVETFYHGFTLHPNKYVPVRPEMAGRDMLRFYLDECHRRGLEYHAWIEVFYWEVDTTLYPQFPKTPLFEKHPEWMTLLRDGRHTGHVEQAHLFAEPAHPQVQRFLVGFLKDMLRRYEIDGLNLDYIRYPAGNIDSGYSEYARKKYKRLAGIAPIDIPVAPANPQWIEWVEFREAQVVQLVDKILRMKEKVKPEIVLSAAIFQEYYNSRYQGHHLQDWKSMLRDGSLDAICPMAYGGSPPGQRKTGGRHEAGDRRMWAIGGPLSGPGDSAANRSISYSSSGHPPIRQTDGAAEQVELPGFSVFCYSWIMDSEEGLIWLK